MAIDKGGLFTEEYVPEPWQAQYHKAYKWSRIRAAVGGSGAAKTRANVCETIALCAEFGGEALCIANSLDTSREIQYEPIMKVINKKIIIKSREKPLYLIIQSNAPDGYARIVFSGADDSSSKAEYKKRGFEKNIIWITECRPSISEEVDRQIHLRTRHTDNAFYLYDTNPEGPDDYFLKKYFPQGQKVPQLELHSHWTRGVIEDKKNDTYLQFLTILHNSHLSQKEVQKIIRDAGDPKGFWYRRMVLGHWVASTGAVWNTPAEEFAEKLEYAS